MVRPPDEMARNRIQMPCLVIWPKVTEVSWYGMACSKNMVSQDEKTFVMDNVEENNKKRGISPVKDDRTDEIPPHAIREPE